MNVKEKLFELKDEKYREFSEKLLPKGTSLIGVRLPLLRKLAKEIIKTDYNFFHNYKFKYLEEKLLFSMVIGLIKDYKTAKKEIESFIPLIDNWSVCDTFCASLKIVKENRDDFFKFLQKYIKSKKEYELRFSLVILLNYYITPEYIDTVFEIIKNVKTNDYYAIMGAAWLFSIAYVKFPKLSLEKLTKDNVQYEIYKKGVSKVFDSYRADKTLKNTLKETL